jgi:hypothetical protein
MSRKRFAIATVALLGLVAISTQAHAGRSAGAPSAGMSSNHLSVAGSTNSNGPNSADRDKGLQRSSDRMSQRGASHEKATQAHSRKKPHHVTLRAHNKNQ